jgi:hypothetical protein
MNTRLGYLSVRDFEALMRAVNWKVGWAVELKIFIALWMFKLGRGKYSQSFCISMMIKAVVFWSKLLSWGHRYGKALTREYMFECQSGKIWGICRILRLGDWILGETLCFFFGFWLLKNEKQLWMRTLGKIVIVDSFPDCSSSLIRGNWIRFDLLVPAGAPQVVASILEGCQPY